MKYQFSYLLKIQFLGFRFSGWQKQVNAKTLHDFIDKSLSFVLPDQKVKTMGMSRTDAKVSAEKYFVQLFLQEELDEARFFESMNANLPMDIRLLEVNPTSVKLDIISAAKVKTYRYYFSFGVKSHPYAAPFLFGIQDELNIELMKEGAKLFKGDHYFGKYCTKPTEHTQLFRTILSCRIEENQDFKASFFPEKSYFLEVKGPGFLRYQIRLMMATLIELGKGHIDLDFIQNSLNDSGDKLPLPFIAPASGLHLHDIELDA